MHIYLEVYELTNETVSMIQNSEIKVSKNYEKETRFKIKINPLYPHQIKNTKTRQN